MSTCIHCDQDVLTAYYNEGHADEGPFCCRGCLTVYNVIHAKGLKEYYEIKKNVSFFKKRAPVEIRSAQYSYLDDEDFKKEYSYKNYQDENTMEFYLEGIHCLACLWIIEKIPEIVAGVKTTKLNMGRSVVTVVLKDGGKFFEVAHVLDDLGYRPHPLKLNQTSQELKTKEERSMLLRIGISGAAAGNIMLYAISLYAGANHDYASLFNFFTVLFAIPVLTYCAYPFYRTSWAAIKNKNLSIDVPISLALIMGGLMGVYNLLMGIHENYFDSLSALVFLLLLSRYFLKIIQEMGLENTDLHFFYQGESVLKLENGEAVEIHPKFIKEADLLKVGHGQMIPADGVIVEGETYLNNSLLTGESQLQKAFIGTAIFSGTMNMGQEILMKVTKTNKETRLGQILKSVENGWGQKAKIIGLTNLVSKYFVAAVFLLSVILFFLNYHQGHTRQALEQALTLLIVTCPCALAIATPLTFIRTLSKCAEKGIIIKDDSVIEALAKVENVFIDKTGTITQNVLRINNFTITSSAAISLNDIIFTLEKNSSHPLAVSLIHYVSPARPTLQPVSDFKETPGVGVSAMIEGHFYEIKNYAVYEDGIELCRFEANDIIRPDATEALSSLRELGLNLKMLSGDKKEHVKAIAQSVGLAEYEYAFQMSPENKNLAIKNSRNTLMIGDGANDAIALSSADTSIAVFGAMDISLRAASVYLSLPGLTPVVDLIVIAHETMKVIYRNLILSLFYNSISVLLAFTGHISPLTAAIIMPLSSLSVLISTLIGTKQLRATWK
jgi:cation transport ATPase